MKKVNKEIQKLKKTGFTGFLKINKIKDNNYSQIPAAKGIYIVLWKSTSQPIFLKDNPGGHFKGKDPTVSIEKLRNNWVQNTSIIYIGKAGSKTSTTTLKKRIKDFIEFGNGKPKSHWGGRYIWQIKDAEKYLLFCWKKVQNIEPRKFEKEFIKNSKETFCKLPFGNLIN